MERRLIRFPFSFIQALATKPAAFWAMLIAIALALACPDRAASQNEPVAVGVLDLTSETVPEAELRILTDRLRAELVLTGRFSVIERERMNAILDEQGFQHSGCVAAECVVEMGQLIGVRKMVAGSIGRIGGVYSVSARVIDVQTGAIERTAVQDCRCELEDVLTGVVSQVAAELAGRQRPAARPDAAARSIVYVSSEPAGAAVLVDGVRREGVTPLLIEDLTSGEHMVRLWKDDLYGEQRVQAEVGGVTRVDVELRRAYGSVSVTTEPAGAELRIDGRRVGRTPATVRSLALGEHTVQTSAEHHIARDTTVVLSPDNLAPEVSFALVPFGYLSFASTPPAADVCIDGDRATGDLSRLQLPVGDHYLVARRAGYDSLAETVTIRRGETTELTRRFRGLLGGIRVTTTPSGALVSSTPDVISGTTPAINTRVEAGEYRISVTLDDHIARETMVNVERGRTTHVELDLPLTPEGRARRALRTKRVAGWTLLGSAVLAGTIGYLYDRDAGDAYSDRTGFHRRYVEATTSADAAYWRMKSVLSGMRGDDLAGKRNILYSVAGVLGGVSVTLLAW